MTNQLFATLDLAKAPFEKTHHFKNTFNVCITEITETNRVCKWFNKWRQLGGAFSKFARGR